MSGAAQRGILCLWPHDWLFVGHQGANRTHRHVAASLLCGLEAPLQLEVQGAWRSTRLALVAPDVPQALDPGNGLILIAHFDPVTAAWRELAGHLAGADGAARASVDLPFDPEWLGVARALLDTPAVAMADTLRARLLTRLACPAPPLDARIMHIATLLREQLPDKLDVASLAAEIGLSASRLTHLFRDQTGVTLRRFLLHLKTLQLFRHWREGMTVSALAAASGFYDQPHLVRTTRDMFDALPSHYMTGGFSVLDCSCLLYTSPSPRD